MLDKEGTVALQIDGSLPQPINASCTGICHPPLRQMVDTARRFGRVEALARLARVGRGAWGVRRRASAIFEAGPSRSSYEAGKRTARDDGRQRTAGGRLRQGFDSALLAIAPRPCEDRESHENRTRPQAAPMLTVRGPAGAILLLRVSRQPARKTVQQVSRYAVGV